MLSNPHVAENGITEEKRPMYYDEDEDDKDILLSKLLWLYLAVKLNMLRSGINCFLQISSDHKYLTKLTITRFLACRVKQISSSQNLVEPLNVE